MFRKHLMLSLFCLVLLVIVVILSLDLFQFRQDPKVYNFSIETKDLRIKGVEFVVYDNSNTIYVTEHELEKVGEDKQFSSVSYGISIGEKMILSLSQADNPFTLPDSFQGKIKYNTRNLIQDIRVRRHDTVHVEVIYEVNGVANHVKGTVKLSDIIKSTSSPDNTNVIRL